jgi:hypothetical protein
MTIKGGMDCQGLITYCVKTAGGKAGWSDSNQLARSYVEGELIPIASAKGDMRGWIGLIIEPINADTPSRYRSDAFALKHGDCSHVGIITQDGTIWSVDASSSAGKVRTRTEREARHCWTHVAKLKDADYSPDTFQSAPSAQTQMYVATDENGLTFRTAPTVPKGADNRVPRMPRIPAGAAVGVLADAGGGWCKVSYAGYEGYVMAKYLTAAETPPSASTSDTPAHTCILDAEAVTRLLEAYTALGAALSAVKNGGLAND